jgi:hypothetical protein
MNETDEVVKDGGWVLTLTTAWVTMVCINVKREKGGERGGRRKEEGKQQKFEGVEKQVTSHKVGDPNLPAYPKKKACEIDKSGVG